MRVGRLTIRLTEGLHEQLRERVGGRGMNNFAIEAIAQKLGRDEVLERVARLEEEVADLKRRLRP